MENLLNEIIKSDKAAEDKLRQAEEYRRSQYMLLQSKKDDIEKEEIKKAVDKILSDDKKAKSAGDQQLAALKSSIKKAEKNMDELYQKNKSQWVKKITDGVING